MLYHSTNHISSKVDFKEATIKGQAPDKGLYFPETIPQLQKNFIDNIDKYSKEEIAFNVIQPYVGNVIPKNELERIVTETINFDFPLVKVEENIFSLELFHGPTLAFKDVGARFMSRCLGYFVKNQNKKITVLVATSGDTGGAVANGFYNVDGVDVVAQQTRSTRFLQRFFKPVIGRKYFAMNVVVAHRYAHGIRGNNHALDDNVGIELQDVAVFAGSRLSLIRVAHQILLARKLAWHEAPLEPRRKTCTATPPQGRLFDGCNHLVLRQTCDTGVACGCSTVFSKNLAQRLITATRFVVLQTPI